MDFYLAEQPLFKLSIPPISPRDKHAFDSTNLESLLRFKSPTSESQKRNAQCCLSSQNRYHPVQGESEEKNSPQEEEVEEVQGIKEKGEKGHYESIRAKEEGQPSNVQKGGSSQKEDAKKMYIGDFTYKEKYAVETMIQQLERELFKSKYFNRGNYESRSE